MTMRPIRPGWERKPGDRFFRVPRVQPWRIFVPSPEHGRRSPQVSLRTLIYGFAATIAVGALLLTLPVASRSGQWSSPVNALFTATSSVCVTGLAVVDTLDHWTFFGQAVVLALIQFGGLGYMTMATLFLIALGRRVGLREKLLIGETIGAFRDVNRLVRNVFLFSASAEILGAAMLFIRFSQDFGTVSGAWKSIFTAVSAFNNAGFDIMGGFRSLSAYQGSALVLLTVAALIIVGGLSYLALADIFTKREFTRLSMDTKMILAVTATLLVLGTLVVLGAEYGNPRTLGPMPLSEKLLNAFFQAVVPRTAGFSSVFTGAMTDYTLFFTMTLMFIGGASGSTAGGIKVSTFGLIFATMWSAIRGREYPGAFEREFALSQIYRALAIVMLAIGLIAVVVFFLSITENIEFLRLLFETVSAFGTVGLSTGITPNLSALGKALLMITMFAGRLGPLTLTLALVGVQTPAMYRYPREIVRLG